MLLCVLCPSCRNRAVPLAHKLAAAADTLVVAQCRSCGAYATIAPERLTWLGGVPELIALPVGAFVFFATHSSSTAVALGLLAYVACFVIGVYRAPLSPFLPSSVSRLGVKRALLLALLAGVLLGIVAVVHLLS